MRRCFREKDYNLTFSLVSWSGIIVNSSYRGLHSAEELLYSALLTGEAESFPRITTDLQTVEISSPREEMADLESECCDMTSPLSSPLSILSQNPQEFSKQELATLLQGSQGCLAGNFKDAIYQLAAS